MNIPVLPYSKSPADGVWQRSTIETFAYSDGDEAENRIASILTAAKDLSVLSGELRAAITDWPSNYHLSSQRANLLRPLSEHLTGSVLEIGSGCGAITRYLGETAQSVLALEGSRRRAHISRTRTRDLTNVEVFCDEFSAFEAPGRFDAVTLIGVLEYAHMFIADEHAALRMLEKTMALLNEQGCLVLAIENQLGLKYFAGAPEDHLGIPSLGIEDQYAAKGVRTYGKHALARLLEQAGFQSVEFLHPFPDYKMPTCVLAEQAFDNPSFNVKPFLVATAGKDPQLPSEPGFNLERAWPVIESNGLTSDLSNSFLVIAKRQADGTRKAPGFAWHFSTQRKQAFCKATVFSENPSTREIEVTRNLLGSKTPDVSGLDFFHNTADDVRYSSSDLLSSQLIDTITRENWTYQGIADFILLYARHLQEASKVALILDGKIDWNAKIPGEFFDCIPQNICVNKNGPATFFDLEWCSVTAVTFRQMAFRSLWTVIGEISLIGRHADNQPVSLFKLAAASFGLLGCELSEDAALEIVQSELKFQSQIAGKPMEHEAVWNWITKGVLRHVKTHQSLAEHKQHCTNMVAHLAHVEATQDLQLSNEKAKLEQLQVAHEAAVAKAEALHQEALRVAQTRFDKLLSEAAHAKRESRETSRAVRSLTQASANRFIGRRTPKNLLKQWIEHRQVVQRSTASPASELRNHALTGLIGAAKSSLIAAPALHACAYVSTDAQAQAFLTRSTHWAFPFDWTFVHDQANPLQNTASLAVDLGIDIAFAQCGPGPAADLRTHPAVVENRPLILLPRTVSPGHVQGVFDGNFPDAESVRLAYMAMVTDPNILAIYIGAPDAGANVGPADFTHGFFCLMRPPLLGALMTDSTMLTQHVDLSTLEQELLIAKKAASTSGRSLLVF